MRTDEARAPIRVARIITRLNIGGPAIQAIELSARLERTGFHTLLIHGRLGADEGDMQYLVPHDRTFEMAYVPSLRREVNPFADAVSVARICALLNRFRPTIVHTHMAKAGSTGRAAALLYNATTERRQRARLVHTYHGHVLDGYFSRGAAAGFAAVERALASGTDALVAVSDSVASDLIARHRIADASRFTVVPLGFDLSRLAALGPLDRAEARAAFGVAPDAHLISWVGRLTAIKQPDAFVEAAARLAARDPAAEFLIVGGGELEDAVRAQVAARGLATRVHLVGWRRDVTAVYAASDLVALTSRNEGTPVALIEAMAAAVPGVAFAVGGVPDVVTGADVGTLVPPGDVEALAESMRQLVENDDRRRQIGAHARASAVTRFAIERLLTDVSTLYRQLIA